MPEQSAPVEVGPAPPRRWGVTIPFDAPLADHRRLLEEVVAAGYTDVWSVEGGGADALTPLAMAAAWTSDLRLGTGVVSSFTRGPGVLAQTASAMADVARGRFVLGIGSSSDVIVRDWNALPFDRPYSRTRDLVRFLRAAFTGEKVSAAYETFSVRNFRLGRPVASPPPIVVAALRERMLRLAGREADGAMVNWLSAEDVRRVSAIVRQENPAAEVVDRIMVCPTEDTDRVRAQVKPLIASYTAVGVYRAFHEWIGRGEALADSWAAWDAGDRKGAARLVPDEVVDQLVVHGSPAACRAHLRRFVESGVTTPVLALIPSGLDDVEALWALAPEPVPAGS
ncbi:MAG: LLM class F420-dependent oxidoreductase [Acidimicrobiales bacterium]